MLTLICSLVVVGCAERVTTTPQPPPTESVVYGVPTAPSSPSPERPTTAGPTLVVTAPPPTAGAVTAPPPGDRGPFPETRLTILHTNDTRGYLDPCG